MTEPIKSSRMCLRKFFSGKQLLWISANSLLGEVCIYGKCDSLEHFGIPSLAWPSLTEGEQSLQKGTSCLWSPEIGGAWHQSVIERPKDHRSARLGRAEGRGVKSGRWAGPCPQWVPLTQQCLFYPEKGVERRKHKFSQRKRIPGASQVALVAKNLLANAGDIRDTSSIPGLGRSPGGGHGNPSSIPAWRIPWTEEPGGLQSMGSQESDLTEWAHTHKRTPSNLCTHPALRS